MSKSLLFILFDTGESEFLTPVLRELDSQTFDLLLFGTSETLSILSTFPQIKSTSLNLSEPVTRDWPREKILPEEDLNIILSIANTYKKCITGVASALQGQILKSCSCQKLMIWDNFKGDDTGDYWRTAQEVQFYADYVIYPSQSTYDELPEKTKNPLISGSPAVEDWEAGIRKIDSDQVRNKLGITKKVLLYIAGWSGDPECNEGTALFASICKNFLINYLNEYEIIVQLHPRSDGNFERSEFSNLAKVNSREICSTEEVVSTATLVVCHKTTAGPKISATGKKLIFLVPQPGYSNKLIEKNICPLAKTQEEFIQVFEKGLECNLNEDVYSAFGMPRNSISYILTLLYSN